VYEPDGPFEGRVLVLEKLIGLLLYSFRTSLIDVLGTALLVIGFWALGYGHKADPTESS
jgi:hypothetical protein